VSPSSNPKQHDFPEVKTKEANKTPKTLSKHKTEKEQNLLGKTLQETWEMFESFMKHGHVFRQITSNIEIPLKYISTQGESTALTFHIPSLTPLASRFDIHSSEVVNVEDMTPIEPEEMTSSELFFRKKRKDIMQRDIHKKGGVITKRKNMIFDGQGQSDPEFGKHVADSLGAFATSNLWSVDNLRENIDQKKYFN
jgi:hypothetical protein